MKLIILILACSLVAISSISQPQVSFELAYSNFSLPVDIATPNDDTDRLFIVEKNGLIYIIEDGVRQNDPFLDIISRSSSNGERGLLGLAFHPDFGSNGHFFINYTNNSGNTVISRWNTMADNPNIADINSEKILITIAQPASNHNAGDLNFSPIDGFLYIPMGDGGSGGDPWCNSQDSTEMLGKILRIDVNQNVNSSPYYGIPADNPFINNPIVPDEIWAFGLRNPWRSSFDRKTGDLWIADVGQKQREEVNLIPANVPGGLNFGWNRMEGKICYDINPDDIIVPCPNTIPICNDDAYTEPIFDYLRSGTTGGFSITGGFVYRGCDYPGLYGYYLATDFISANSWYIDQSGSATLFTGAPEEVSTYGEDKNGELYVASLDGNLYRVVDSSVLNVLVLDDTDFPLSGMYSALDSIIIDSDLEINSSDVIFNTDVLKVNELSVSNSSDIIIGTCIEEN